MTKNVAASMTASIIIDKKEVISSALEAYAAAQKELDGNKIELLIDVSSDEAIKKIKDIQQVLSGKEYIIKFRNQGIEEILHSLDDLEKRIINVIDSTNNLHKTVSKGSKNSMIDEDSLKTILDLFTKMESHLSSMKKLFVDVGDGQEFSPLLKIINNVQNAVKELSTSVSKIKLNVNIESKGNDEQLLAKAEGRKQDLLNAYKDQYEAMKGIKPSAATVIGSKLSQETKSKIAALNKMINSFSGSDADNVDQKIADYAKVAKMMREVSELSYGKDIYSEMDKTYQKNISSAKGNLTRVQNALTANSGEGIENLFGKTDFTEVIAALDKISGKLDQIVISAKDVKDAFTNGLKFESSIGEIENLTNKIKNLENELSKVKLNPNSLPKTKDDQTYADEMVSYYKNRDSEYERLKKIYTEEGHAQTEKAYAAEYNKQLSVINELYEAQTKLNNIRAKAVKSGNNLDHHQIEAQEKEVEKLTLKATEAKNAISSMFSPRTKIISYAQWSDAAKAFDQATKGSTDSVAKLKDALDSVNKKTEEFNKKKSGDKSFLSSIETAINRADKDVNLRQRKPKDEDQSTAYKNMLVEYQLALANLRTEYGKLKQQDILSSEDITKIRKLKSEVDEAAQSFKTLYAAEKGSINLSRDKVYDKIGVYLQKNSGMTKEFKDLLKGLQEQLKFRGADANVSDLTDEFVRLKGQIREANQEGRSFFSVLRDKAWYGLAAQIGTYFGFNDLVRLGENAINTIVGLDTALVDLRKTTSMTSTQLSDFYYDANDVAKQMNVSTQEIINQASAWSRLGYSTAETSTKMAKLSSQFSAISPDLNVDDSTSGLVSIMKAFKISADDVKEDVMSTINTLGNEFATSNGEIVTGLKKSSAAMAAMGQSYRDTVALFVAGQEILQDADTMGTALRSVSMRIRGYSEETGELDEELVNLKGDVLDLTKTAKDSQGVSLFTDASQTHYKSMVQYLGEIADRWDDISEKDQTDLLQKLFGKTRVQAGAAILSNFDQVQAALEAMNNSAGSADAEMEIIESSIEFKLNRLKETWVGTAQEIIDRGSLGAAIDGLTSLSEAIGFVIDKLGILGTLSLGTGVYAFVKNLD